MAAYELTKKSGFYDKNPGTDVSVEQMIVKTTEKSRGMRLGNFVQIRDIIEEELEARLARQEDGEGRRSTTRGRKRGNEHDRSGSRKTRQKG